MSYSVGDMMLEYETNCERFEHEGVIFYLHNIETCRCTSCWRTRVEAESNGRPKPEGSVVTLNIWKEDKHFYQNLGKAWDKFQAAERCLRYKAEGERLWQPTH